MSKFLRTFLPLCTLLLLLATFLSFNSHPTILENPWKTPKRIHASKHLQTSESTCEGTLYPDLCVSTIAAFPELRQKTLLEVISHTVNVTMKEVQESASNCSTLHRKLLKKSEALELGALEDCSELFSYTMDELTEIRDYLVSTSWAEKYYDDIQTLLSGAMTNQYTCLDGFGHSKSNSRRFLEGRLKRISRHLSNTLAMMKKLKGKIKEDFPEFGTMKGELFPFWLKKKDRKLLQTAVNETKYDLIVAQDGSGDFTTINEALSVAPNKSETRFVIYIKTGAYYEYVEVDKTKRYIMFLGDGIGNTWIKGNRNHVDGWDTFRSATVTVVGKGFIAKGISIENYAGPSKHQAVALRSSADYSAFYSCRFVGYQDTLYVHSLRQFYRECDVYGTVDFIFGNAAVVFQNSNLYARRPDSNQQNIYTAQGRDDPNQNTGISILNCKIAAGSELLPNISEFRTYLGRPWKEYSRAVFMFSYMEEVVNPKGFMEWNGTFALDTLYYGEYMNRGPGSSTADRVDWPGYRVINDSAEASQFTVANFITGDQWLPATGIPFFPNLLPTDEYPVTGLDVY